MDIEYKKLSEQYEFTKENPNGGAKVTLSVTVHLDSKVRTVSISPPNNNQFKFHKSDPFLIETISEIMSKAVEVAHKAERTKSK